ncbi:MAG: hypothetical protein IKN49_03880 [Elusimicrobiaceae bacterium]|nr:hypothetical protein [Elusimicrobiaceae bacterium]
MRIVVVCLFILIAMASCQKIYEANLLKKQEIEKSIEKEVWDNILEVNKTTQDYNTSTTPEEMEKDMRKVVDGIVKTMAQEMLARAKKIHVPTPMLQDTSFLYSKVKLNAAIKQQDTDIKQYKKEINLTIDDIINGSKEAMLTDCAKKYPKSECEKFKKPIEDSLAGAKNKLTASIPFYVDYIEEELNAMRFISNHYNSFTTSGQFPHFTDAALQKQFMAKIQEVDRKGRAVADLRNNAWQDAHNKVSKI